MSWTKLLPLLPLFLLFFFLVRRILQNEERQDREKFIKAQLAFVGLGQQITLERLAQARAGCPSPDIDRPITEEEFLDCLAAEHFTKNGVEPAQDWHLLNPPPVVRATNVPDSITTVDIEKLLTTHGYLINTGDFVEGAPASKQ